VVLDSLLILSQVVVGAATVAIGYLIFRVETYGFIVVLDSLLILSQVIVGETTVVISFGVSFHDPPHLTNTG
jgi:hypothetical protein